MCLPPDLFHSHTQVLAAGILLWSTATLFTPWAANHSLTALLTTRAIMGFGEGVALPCMNNLMARWVGKSARARAVGICMAGFHVGSMAGLLAAPPLMGTKWGVGGPFYLFGVLGFAWLATWLALVPDSTPLLRKVQKLSEDKVGGNRVAGEITLIRKLDIERKAGNGGYAEAGRSVEAMNGQKVGGSRQIPASKLPPFGLLLSKAPTWAIIVANSVNNWVSASGQLGIALCLHLLLRPSCGSLVSCIDGRISYASCGKTICPHLKIQQ